MAPEIVNKVEYCGPPADVWAMGVLLFALLNGRFPFKGKNDPELYAKINKVDLVFGDHMTTASKNFLMRIFKTNAEERPTMRELLKDPWLTITEFEHENFMRGNFSTSNLFNLPS